MTATTVQDYEKKLMASERPTQRIHSSPFFEISNKLARFEHWGYIPTKQQLQAHECDVPFLGLFAGARFGKTLFAANEALYTLLYPSAQIWLCGMSFDHTNKEFNTIIDLMRRCKIDKNRTLMDICRVSAPDKGSRRITTPWYSMLETKATDGTNAKRNLGASLDLVVLCEGDLIKMETYLKYLVPRLSDRQGRVILPSSPSTDYGIVKYFKDRESEGDPSFRTFTFSVLDNPFIDKGRIEILKSQLSETDYQEQVEGKIVHRVGFVFPEFRESLHVFKDFPQALLSLPTVIGLRYRFNEASCLVAMRYDRKTRSVYVYEEYFTRTTDANQIKAKIKEIADQCPRLVGCICASDDVLTASEMRRVGVNVLRVERAEKTNLKNLVLETSTIKNSFRLEVPLSFNLRISENCEKLVKEIKTCRWPDSRLSAVSEDRAEVPVLHNFVLSRCVAHCLLFLGDNVR